MKRSTPLSLAAALIAVACTGDSVTPPIGGPLASFFDGAHQGNPDFFFLPPLLKNPINHPDFEPGAFNARVQPAVEICELGLPQPDLSRSCIDGPPVRRFPPSEVQLSAGDEHYQVNWHTDESNLDPLKEYRIRVLLGTTELGFTDVDPVASGKELKNVETGELIGLVDGRTLPIKFRIEDAALCQGVDPCNSGTIDLSEGGTVVLEETGDRVDIPPQPNSDQVVTVTLQQCDGIDVDLPVFGNCLTVTADPPLAAALFPRGVVSMCSLDIGALPLTHEQAHLVTLHRQDDGLITALPHAYDFCEEPIGRANNLAPPRNLAEAGWRALQQVVGAVFGARPLHASTTLLNLGGGGETDEFSDFQFALPARMLPLPGTDGQSGLPGSPVEVPPGVHLTDAHGDDVAGATVHFEVAAGDGSVAPIAVVSDAAGIAQVDEWLLGAAGSNEARATGRGIADPDDAGPFTPNILLPPAEQGEVPVGSGEVVFTATVGAPDLVIESIEVGPSDLTFADRITYDVTVRNEGSATAPATTIVVDGPSGLSPDGVGADVLNVPSLPQGSAATLRATLGPRVPGTASVTALADPNDGVAESNEENNAFTSEPFTVAPKVDFETTGNGTPITPLTLPPTLSNVYDLQGVVFSFQPASPGGACATNAQVFLSSPTYDPAGGPANHSVSAAQNTGLGGGFCLGIVTMTFAGLPTTVTFHARGNNSIPDFPVSALDASGSPIPPSQITRTNVSTYTPAGGGFVGRQETVTITNSGGVARVDLLMVTFFIYLLDNLIVGP